MSGATSTTAAEAIVEAFQAPYTEGVYRNNDIFRVFGEPVPAPRSDSAYRFLVNSTGNTSVQIFTEGQAQPGAGNQGWVAAAVAYMYVRGMVQITGHLKDNLQDGGWVDAIDLEMTNLIEDIRDLISTTIMGATETGLQVSIDSTTTYAGIARGSAGYWESSETPVSDVMSYEDMVDLDETIRDNDKGGRTGAVLMPWNQVTRYTNITGGPAIKQMVGHDIAEGITAPTFNGAPVIGMGDMTNTVALFLDTRPGSWDFVEKRPFSVKEMAPSGDSDLFQVSNASVLVNKQPKKMGKLTGLTA